MSADNGIYILETKGYKLFSEYRVVHAQAIENIYNEDGGVNLFRLYQYFSDSKILLSKKEALAEAEKKYEEIVKDCLCPIVEYGICDISHPEITFPELPPPCCYNPNVVKITPDLGDPYEQCSNCGEYL